jgi:hypothetical protein
MDAEAVPRDVEADAARSSLLPPLQFFIVKLKNCAAGVANHVVMMIVADHMFKAPAAIARIEPFHDPTTLQHQERAIYGCPGHLGILLATPPQQFFGSEMLMRAKRRSHNQGALTGPTQAGAAQVVFDNALLCCRLHDTSG